MQSRFFVLIMSKSLNKSCLFFSMETNRTITYNIQSVNAFSFVEDALARLTFCNRPNLLARDTYTSAKLRKFFELVLIFKTKKPISG